MNDWMTNLQKRKKETWRDLFRPSLADDEQALQFYSSPCDLGVIRNGGRRGARHAPHSLLHHLKSMVRHHESPLCEEYFLDPHSGHQEFTLEQKRQIEFIDQHLKTKAIHIGGGHDHIFPFAKAIAKKCDHLHIINIDAHLDTRRDEIFHSGTPFRQLKKDLGDKLTITQVGIRSSANVEDNYQNLEMNILTMEDVRQGALSQIKIEPQATLFLSIDCDGIDASLMPAVSATNPDGLTMPNLIQIKDIVTSHWKEHNHLYLGIYEFNPLFDNVSSTSAKFITHYIRDLLS